MTNLIRTDECEFYLFMQMFIMEMKSYQMRLIKRDLIIEEFSHSTHSHTVSNQK